MKNADKYKRSLSIRLLLAGLSMLLVASLSGQVTGDYKSKSGYGACANPSGWSYYDGTAWVDATVIPPSPFPAGNTIYLDHTIYCDRDLDLAGKIVMSSTGGMILILGAHLQIMSTGIVQNNSIQIGNECKITNNGHITSAVDGAKIFFEAGDVNKPTTLINNGSIELIDDGNSSTFNMTMNGYGLLKSGADGYIYGTGSISVSNQYPRFEIANAGGFISPSGAIRLTGTKDISKAEYLFNGIQAQNTGQIPSPIFNMVFDNPAGVKLENDIVVHPNGDKAFVTVNSGATLDMGPYIIETGSDWGGVVFNLEAGATLITQHPEGISSETIPDRISKGCIQPNTAHYSSAANYWYNREGDQHSGNFVTEPEAHTVNDFTVGNNTNLILDWPGGLPTVNGTYTDDDDTLPVTLSSFTAMAIGFNKVRILWKTESETNCLGYHVWRADSADLNTAIRISSMIQAANSSQGALYACTDTDIHQAGTYYYWLEDISINHESQFHGYIYLTLEHQVNDQSPEVVERTGFRSNYPNPFNPSTTLRYGLSEDSDVSIRFYNERGQLIDSRQLMDQKKGLHKLVWNTRDLGLPSGIYFARLNSKNGSDLLKITLSE